MASVEKFRRHPVSQRTLHLLELDSVDDWPEDLDLKSKHFVLFLACDAEDLADEDLATFLRHCLKQGMVYLSVWGPDCERVHDVFDDLLSEWDPDSTADSVVMSEWHADEKLSDALWFAVHSASPAHDYEKTCKATLAASVGNPDWAEEIRGWLDDPERLEEAVEEEVPDEEDDGDEGSDDDFDLDDDEEDEDLDEDDEDYDPDEDEDYS